MKKFFSMVCACLLALSAQATDIKNVTVNDKTYKKIDEKGITLDF